MMIHKLVGLAVFAVLAPSADAAACTVAVLECSACTDDGKTCAKCAAGHFVFDGKCKALTRCNLHTDPANPQYISKEPTETTNRECSALAGLCTDDQYLEQAPTDKQNRICKAIIECTSTVGGDIIQRPVKCKCGGKICHGGQICDALDPLAKCKPPTGNICSNKVGKRSEIPTNYPCKCGSTKVCYKHGTVGEVCQEKGTKDATGNTAAEDSCKAPCSSNDGTKLDATPCYCSGETAPVFAQDATQCVGENMVCQGSSCKINICSVVDGSASSEDYPCVCAKLLGEAGDVCLAAGQRCNAEQGADQSPSLQCEKACSIVDGSGISANYPCECGNSGLICQTNTKCDAATEECEVVTTPIPPTPAPAPTVCASFLTTTTCPVDCYWDGNACEAFIQAAKLSAATVVGATLLPVVSNAGFVKGREVAIDVGDLQEVRTIKGFGSLVVDSPLKKAHAADAPVAMIGEAPGSKTSLGSSGAGNIGKSSGLGDRTTTLIIGVVSVGLVLCCCGIIAFQSMNSKGTRTVKKTPRKAAPKVDPEPAAAPETEDDLPDMLPLLTAYTPATTAFSVQPSVSYPTAYSSYSSSAYQVPSYATPGNSFATPGAVY